MGDSAQALKTSQLAVELYPDSPAANFLEGISWMLNKDNGARSGCTKEVSGDQSRLPTHR